MTDITAMTETVRYSAAGIILAGGRSRRMGRDKALLPLPGVLSSHVTFVEQLVTLLTATCSEVVLVARDAEQAQTYASYLAASVRIVCDEIAATGPLMGLYSGLSAIHATHALVTAVDTPFLQPALIAFLLSQQLDDMLLVPVVAELPQVLLAVYPRSILPIIAERLQAGRRDPRSLLQVAPVRYIEEEQLRLSDTQLRSFINVNTPTDFANLA